MDVLKSMTTFLRVVEAGSLSAAARDLGISQPAVSQQVSALEAHLNVRLINRTTREMTLTEAGRTYRQKAQHIIEAVQEAGEAVGGLTANLAGHLRIHAPAGFGQSHVADVAVAFQQRNPNVVIELILEDQFVDLTAQAVDVAIRFGTLPSSTLIARRLGTVQRIVVAAPAYIAANGNPETSDELAHHVQVQFNGASDGHLMPLVGPSGPELVPVRPIFMANNAFALSKALKAGIGLGGVQLPLVGDALNEGTLVRVMTKFQYAPLSVHAVYPSGRFIPSKAKAFVDFLEESAKSVW